MAYLGKCLLFHLKYPVEMERLFEADNPNFDDLPNPVELKSKIKLVGDAAGQEAAEFLEMCAPRIEERLLAISAARRKRSNMKLTWQLEFRVAPRKAPDRHFWIGVAFAPPQRALIPWVWCRGGRRAADEIIRILGRGERAAKYDGWGNGSVALQEIKIPIPDRFDEPVECDSLVEQVQQTFAPFTAQQVKAIAALSGIQRDA